MPIINHVYDIAARYIGWLPRFHPMRKVRPVVMLYPSFITDDELLDAYFKARYFLPPEYISQIIIPVAFQPSFQLTNLTEWPRPSYIADLKLPEPSNITIIKNNPISIWQGIFEADYLFLWDQNALKKSRLPNLHRAKFKNVDRHINPWDGWSWAPFIASIQSKRGLDQQRADAQLKFQEVINGLPPYSKSYIFGTGPSLDFATQYNFSDGYRIACNTIVKNDTLLDHIQPHFIVAGDAIYHFGNTQHAYQFRCDLEKAIKNFNLYFLLPEQFYPLFKHYHPSVIDHTIPVRSDLNGISLNLKKQLNYTNLHNILNGLLLPLGSSLSNDIYLLGFDGRGPSDALFWTNSSANSYSELKPSIMAAHPGFFSGIDYVEYAQMQSDNAEKIMSLGESQGKLYHCLNQTYIPSLRKRQCTT